MLRNIGGDYFNPRLHYGRRPIYSYYIFFCIRFQSTPPLWEATKADYASFKNNIISIHASTMGGDLYQELWKKDFLVFQSTPPLWEATSDIIGGVDVNTDFNPRLHYGRRLASTADNMFSILFQSTPPLWEATFLIRDEEGNIKISIHASTMGGDYLSKYFQ